MKAQKFKHIVVGLEALVMRTDLVLVREVRMEVSNIIMMKEDVFNIPKKIQDTEVSGETLSA